MNFRVIILFLGVHFFATTSLHAFEIFTQLSHDLSDISKNLHKENLPEKMTSENVKKLSEELMSYDYLYEVSEKGKELECSVEPDKKNKVVELYLNGKNKGSCDFFKIIEEAQVYGYKNYKQAIEKMNWDPCCMTDEILDFMEKNEDKNIQGFTIGKEIVRGVVRQVKFADGVFGREVVVLLTPEDKLQVAVVSYIGGGAALALPFGFGVTHSVIHGECKNIEDSYLGLFYQVLGLGNTESWGVEDKPGALKQSLGLADSKIQSKENGNPLQFWNNRPSGCNSSGDTKGLTWALAGSQIVNYSKSSEVFELKGPRVEELKQAIKLANQKNKFNGSIFKPDQTFNKSKYKKKNCNTGIYRHLFKSFPLYHEGGRRSNEGG